MRGQRSEVRGPAYAQGCGVASRGQRQRSDRGSGPAFLWPSKLAKIDQARNLMKRGSIGILLLSVVVPLAGCTINFRTKSVYRAPTSQYQVEIVAWGEIESGADITNKGNSDVKISSDVPSALPIMLKIREGGQAIESVISGVKRAFAKEDLKRVLIKSLTSAGITAENNEVTETAKAIYGAMAGSKATLMPGQTKVLDVVDVDLFYKER